MKSIFINRLSIWLTILFLVILVFVSIISSDWRYAHRSHGVYPISFDWLTYKAEIAIHKIKRSFSNDKRVSLPQVYLYLSEKSQKKLLEDVPRSTKLWQKGHYLLNDGSLKKIKVRHQGDNPVNWLLEKKSWRIKTRKKDMFGMTRVINYSLPQVTNILHEYSAASIANRMGILSAKVKLVELFINDESHGIYIETEHINESFLRRNKIMPVNLYKGEQWLSENFIGTVGHLFNNHGLWKKSSEFNQVAKSDKTDLADFLSIVRDSENNEHLFKKMMQRADFEVWSKFAAYQILTQNYHNDNVHNARLVIDPWNGIVSPIAHDPFIVMDNLNEIQLEESSHTLLSLLNRSSLFIDKKYNFLLDFSKNYKILTEEAESLRGLEEKIQISSLRDFGPLQTVYVHYPSLRSKEGWDKSVDRDFLSLDGGIAARMEFSNYLENRQKKIIEILSKKPDSSWYFDKGKGSIFIDGYSPISNLVFKYDSDAPEWIALDLNENNIIDDTDKVFRLNNNNTISIPVRLYANRINSSNTMVHIDKSSTINTTRTKFNFISENFKKPLSVVGSNPFSKEVFTLENKKYNAVLASKYNRPLPNFNLQNDKILQFSGIVKVPETMFVNDRSRIIPGTIFRLGSGASVIFKNRVEAIGSAKDPIIFEGEGGAIWGTVAILGDQAQGSRINNIIMRGGSGGNIDGIRYTSMFSLHNTADIVVDGLKMKNNHIYDDMMHIIYSDRVTIKNSLFDKAYSDAIDIDMSSRIKINNIVVKNPGNDSIDLMESKVLIKSSELVNSSDKAISAGENSEVLVCNSVIHDNSVAVASKDKSIVNILYSRFNNNNVHLSSYAKNWRYGGGGEINIYDSLISGSSNKFLSEKGSSISINNSLIKGDSSKIGPNVFIFKNKNPGKFEIKYKTSDDNFFMCSSPV